MRFPELSDAETTDSEESELHSADEAVAARVKLPHLTLPELPEGFQLGQHLLRKTFHVCLGAETCSVICGRPVGRRFRLFEEVPAFTWPRCAVCFRPCAARPKLAVLANGPVPGAEGDVRSPLMEHAVGVDEAAIGLAEERDDVPGKQTVRPASPV